MPKTIDAHLPGRDGASYGSYATFSDPDGNSRVLQEVTERFSDH
ncbi:hypothetical protein ACFW2D_14345 [Streptomyces sp. NPDC058914]